MALVLLNSTGGMPYGQFDGYDGLSLLGGEVATLTAYGVSGTDKHAKDVEDGYSVSGLNTVRPIVTTTLVGTEKGGMLFLTDDGTTNYGTMFGVLVGSIAGQVVTGGTVLGPATNAGSGKVTLWQSPGLYGVTLDALDTTNLNATTSITVGASLSFTTAGKITPIASSPSGSGTIVGRFVEFATSGSLVTSSSSLVEVGIAGGVKAFKMMVMAWHPVIS